MTTPDKRAVRRLVTLDSVGSTNTELQERYARDPEEWPHFSALLAENQTAGRGRLGRSWQTPPGQALTASLLLRPRVTADAVGWVTLLTGLAVCRAIAALPSSEADIPAPPVGTKWPNDVLIGGAPHLDGWGEGRKVAGILTELPASSGTPSAPRHEPATDRAAAPAVIVGLGINLHQDADELPVPSATSLRAAGLQAPAAPDLLQMVAGELAKLISRWEDAGGAAPPPEVRRELHDSSWTLGRLVRVELPGGETIRGYARDLDDAGHLIVVDGQGEEHVAIAGDVQHVRAAAAR